MNVGRAIGYLLEAYSEFGSVWLIELLCWLPIIAQKKCMAAQTE